MAGISPSTYTGPYTANGSQTAFPFDFTANSSSEVAVEVDGVTVSPALYSVALASDYNSGTVTFLTAPANAALVKLYANPDFTQSSEFENEGAYKLSTVNTINRRSAVRDLWLRAQALLLSPPGFATAANRAGKFLGWGGGGDPVLLSGTGADSALRTDLAASGGSALAGFIQSGSGATARSAQTKLREIVSPEDFGAVGNGSTDDYAALSAALTALPAGGVLRLKPGKTYKLLQSLILTKPVRIEGGAKENTFLDFTGGTYTTIDGKKAGIILLHSSTVLAGYTGGDARGTHMSGFTIKTTTPVANMRALSIHVRSYYTDIDVMGFASDGFAVVATNGTTAGNANGSSFRDCSALSNGGNGFLFQGNDANRCKIDSCSGFNNTGWGFDDQSLIGNRFDNIESDGNTAGSIRTSVTVTNRSTYSGGFFETGQTPSLGPRTIGFATNDTEMHSQAVGGVVLCAIPTGEGYSTQAFTFAANSMVANSGGDSPNAGPFLRVGAVGVDYRATSSSLHLKINGVLSVNYTDILSGGTVAIRFPNSAVAGNIAQGRPHLPNGATFGVSGVSGIVGSATSAPAATGYVKGAIFLNENVASGQPMCWGHNGTIFIPGPNYP